MLIPRWCLSSRFYGSFLVQAISGKIVDDKIDIGNLTDKVLESPSKERKPICFKFLGASSIMFEMVLDIAVKEVLG